jgi:hypothetical protein
LSAAFFDDVVGVAMRTEAGLSGWGHWWDCIMFSGLVGDENCRVAVRVAVGSFWDG